MDKLFSLLDTISNALNQEYLSQSSELREEIKKARQAAESIADGIINGKISKRINTPAMSDEEFVFAMYGVADQMQNPLEIKNKFDGKFAELISYLWANDEKALVEGMKNNLNLIKEKSQADYDGFVQYFKDYPLWGTFDPENGDYNTFELRAATLKRHSYDFLWQYKRLSDYLSKRTLYAILLNWAVLSTKELSEIKSVFPDYYEPDIFPDNKGDVFVDIGAFVGDSILKYVDTYGQGYSKIYAYEISADSFEGLCKNIKLAKLHNVIPQRKAVSKEPGVMYINHSGSSAAANQIASFGRDEDKIEIVRLDEDINERVSFIKMDIEGAEYDALLGAAGIIEKYRPKLAVCTYHGYDDIWELPYLINGIAPDGYSFYLRHNGGNLPPTEFVLLCKPVEAD